MPTAMARSSVKQLRPEICRLSQLATQNAVAAVASKGQEIEDNSESGLLLLANPKLSTFWIVGSVVVRTSISVPVIFFNRVSLLEYLRFCIFADNY